MLNFESQLQVAAQRLEAALLRAEKRGTGDKTSNEALLFNLERAAWAMIEMASAWVFELRLGIARKEAENFDLLQREGRLGLDEARRFKQLCEFRNLSSRDPQRIDWNYLTGDLSIDLELFRRWNEHSRNWLASQEGSPK